MIKKNHVFILHEIKVEKSKWLKSFTLNQSVSVRISWIFMKVCTLIVQKIYIYFPQPRTFPHIRKSGAGLFLTCEFLSAKATGIPSPLKAELHNDSRSHDEVTFKKTNILEKWHFLTLKTLISVTLRYLAFFNYSLVTSSIVVSLNWPPKDYARINDK